MSSERAGPLPHAGGVAIRAAVAADAAALAAFGERTFREAFGADNRPDDIDAYVAETYGEARQAAELADPDRTTLVSVAPDGSLAGFAQLRLGPAPASVRGPRPVELLRFYVDRPWQGRGVAQTLMTAALDAARSRGAATVWLGVWERNLRAIAFYRSCGFGDVGGQEFVLGSDRQADRVMARSLGALQEPPEDDSHDSLLACEAALRTAQLEGDVAALERLLDDALVFTGSDGAVYGKTEDLDAHRRGWVRITRLEPSEERVERYGGVAVVSVRMEMAGSWQGVPFEGPFRYMRVWRRTGDGWRIVAGHVSAVVR